MRFYNARVHSHNIWKMNKINILKIWNITLMWAICVRCCYYFIWYLLLFLHFLSNVDVADSWDAAKLNYSLFPVAFHCMLIQINDEYNFLFNSLLVEKKYFMHVRTDCDIVTMMMYEYWDNVWIKCAIDVDFSIRHYFNLYW